ncbi:MAG: AMP-binding protein, partial [Deferrisomatales bacterium]
MTTLLAGCSPYDPADAERYQRLGWWPGLTLGDLLDRAAERWPDREAFVDGRTRLTYGQARQAVDRLVEGFAGLGIGALDRVLVQLPNWNEFVLAYFALQKLGAIPVLLIDRYRQHEVSHLVRLTGATGWVVAGRYKNVDYLPIIEDVRAEHPELRHVVVARGEGGYPTLEGLAAAAAPPAPEALARRRPDPGQVAHLAPTG